MNTESGALNEPIDSQRSAISVISPTRAFYWSLRREIWENRSIYIAPLLAACVFLFGFLINVFSLRRRMAASPLGPGELQDLLQARYELAAALIMGIELIVGLFYSLDALYGERRDRSILFWKSLPLSDLTTVLSKFTIPMIVLPIVGFLITIAAQLIMLVLSSATLLGSGTSLASLWEHVSFFQMSVVWLYHFLTVHGLWYAPFYGWLFLISAWAPRTPFIWAFAPPFVMCGLEKIAFNTTYCLSLIVNRLGGPQASLGMTPDSSHRHLTSTLIPVHFFSEPGLWIGFAVAAAFLFGAIRLRRYRGPI